MKSNLLHKDTMDNKLILLFVGLLHAYIGLIGAARPSITPQNVNDLVNMHLFIRGNERNPERLTPGQSNRLMRSRINIPIALVIHGWMESGGTNTVTSLRKQLLRHQDINVIAVDWVEGSREINYYVAAANTRPVGNHIGALLNSLINEGANPNNIHIIGHSLGAHVAGFAGAATRGRIARISGLDPAQPGFERAGINDRLDPTDARFVDVMHTSGGLYGLDFPVGHADFFPNGGKHRQPGCVPAGMCSHMRAVEFYEESIDRRHRFPAMSCPSVPSNSRGCTASNHIMGHFTNSTARGNFWVETNSRSPYATDVRRS